MPYNSPQNLATAASRMSPSAQPYWTGKIGNAIGNNSNMLIALGLGLLDKRQNNQVPFSDIGQQAMIGSQIDQQRKAKNMTVDWLVNQKGLSEAEAQAAVANPVILSSYLAPKKSSLTAVGADSALYNEDTGEWMQPPGGGVGKPTDDIREFQLAKEQGFPGTFLDYQIKMREAGRAQTTINTGDFKIPPGYKLLDENNPSAGVTPIPGGPAEQMPAELAARVGMADSFLQQAPEIKQELEAGATTGVYDRAQAGWNSSSAQAEVLRKMKSGTDALQRMLTGAGMPVAEAAEYAGRYLPTYTDDASSAAQKLDQLVMELKRIKEMAMRGRGESAAELPPMDDLYDKYGLER